jgi:hypothetical protein
MRRLPRLALACAVLLSIAGCAPRPLRVVPLDGGGRAALYRSRLAGREQRARMAVGEATLWARGPAACDTCAASQLPAVQAELALLAPGDIRLRVRSAFGTAVDVGLRGDSLTAYAPGLGLAVALDAVRDSFGPPAPGRLAARLVSAVWAAPASAAATWREGGLELRWREDGDSLAVTVGEDGLPGDARLWRDGSAGVGVRYTRWEVTDGVAWPMAWSLESAAGGAGLACRMERVTFPARPDPGRLTVKIPADAERVGPAELRRLLGSVGLSR